MLIGVTDSVRTLIEGLPDADVLTGPGKLL
jgi:hypothetical protein